MYGKYPANAPEADKSALMEALEKMISTAVAIAPESSEIEIESLANKGSVTNLHLEYINAANAEMSKAVLGQTLTTEIGAKGSYAAAQAHNLVREDLAQADRRRICAAFNRLASAYTFYNFGADVIPPVFTFVKDEDLQTERAERDTKLFSLGWRPKKSYIAREYGIPEEDFELGGGKEAAEKTFTVHQPAGRFGTCSCGCGTSKKPSLFQRFLRLFASKEEKSAAKDELLMAEFEDKMLTAGQEEVNKIVGGFADALGGADSYEAAFPALAKAYGKASPSDFAYLIDEVRFAAQGIGGAHG
jgi:phage gp29-like protein